MADWYEFRNIATSSSGLKKLRTYSTTASSVPISSAPSTTRNAPHSSTIAIVTFAIRMSPGSRMP